MRTGILFLCAVLIFQVQSSDVLSQPQGKDDASKRCYLFSYFKGNGEDGLHLCYSYDGLQWNTINNDESLMKPEVGESKLVRDPCVLYGPDGMFHMIWTTSWTGKTIGYANSKDLIHWSEQKAIPVMGHEPKAMNCWAPELFYDEEKGNYLIFWSTTIPGRFPETDMSGNKGRNHRIYCTTTRDFETFTPTKLFFDPGFNCIDATIEKAGNRFVMFFKDEILHPEEHRYIMVTTSKDLYGPYEPHSPPLTGNLTEGPTAIKVGNTWFLYFDKYGENRFGLITSKDLKNWEDISSRLSFPADVRHGTIFEVSQPIIENLLALD